MNDEPFDSTYLRNKSFQFKLGACKSIVESVVLLYLCYQSFFTFFMLLS